MRYRVPTSCRSRLRPSDIEFISEVLSGGKSDAACDALIELCAEDESIEAFLEHPKLLEAILQLKHPLPISPDLYFYVLVRHALRDAKIDDANVADYVASTLCEYAKGNPLTQSTSATSLDSTYHVDFLQTLDHATSYDRFYLHVCCGNRFMVLTGLFPGFIERRQERRGAPGLHYYEGVAREAFHTAGHHPLAEEFALSNVYHQLSSGFCQTRHALNRLAREFLFL